MSTFQGKLIADSYTGILHSEGEIPSSGKTPVYDGLGNTSSLSIGRNGNGATVSGQLSASNLKVGTQGYPSTTGSVGSIVIQETSGSLGYTASLSGSYLSDLNPSPIGSYDNGIKRIDVNAKGLVTDVEEIGVISDPKLVSRTQFVVNPTSVLYENIELDSEWTEINLSLKSQVPKGAKAKSATLFLLPSYQTIQDVSTAGKNISIRASRSGPKTLTGGDNLNDPVGHRCYFSDASARIGVQCSVSIGNANEDGGSGDAVVYLRDRGNYCYDSESETSTGNSTKWQISVESYGY